MVVVVVLWDKNGPVFFRVVLEVVCVVGLLLVAVVEDGGNGSEC